MDILYLRILLLRPRLTYYRPQNNLLHLINYLMHELSWSEMFSKLPLNSSLSFSFFSHFCNLEDMLRLL